MSGDSSGVRHDEAQSVHFWHPVYGILILRMLDVLRKWGCSTRQIIYGYMGKLNRFVGYYRGNKRPI